MKYLVSENTLHVMLENVAAEIFLMWKRLKDPLAHSILSYIIALANR